MSRGTLEDLLGPTGAELLDYRVTGVDRGSLQLPSADVIERNWLGTDRNSRVLRNLQWLYSTGRLAGTGYLSILPVDQGVEHSAGYAFGPNPEYFDPDRLVQLAIEGGCNGIATTYGGLSMVSRRYAHRLPMIVKLNHNELLTYPNFHDMTMFADVEAAYELGAAGAGATIYFGSREARRQIEEVSRAFAEAHRLGMFTILWCYLRNAEFKRAEGDFNSATDLTGQANHLGVTIGADIIKQKMPSIDGGFRTLKFGMTHASMYESLSSDHAIDRVRYQVLHCYGGRVPLLNSGGASGTTDLQDVALQAVVNKRAGGAGIIVGRKAFQRPLREGVEMLHTIQDIYLDPLVTIA